MYQDVAIFFKNSTQNLILFEYFPAIDFSYIQAKKVPCFILTQILEENILFFIAQCCARAISENI